jgi:signal peptidase II
LPKPSIESASTESSSRRRPIALVAFALVALAIAVSDQLLKSWVVDNYKLNRTVDIVGDWLRIDFIHNAGGLFGILQGSAEVFGLVTIVVVLVLVILEIGSGWRSWLVTITLALLLGGAIGNFIDRIQYKYVRDFADIGVGTLRFPYIFNVADAAVTCAIGLMILLWLVSPHLGSGASSDEKGR